MASPCPDAGRWGDLLDSRLPEPVAATLSSHLDGCPDCQQTLDRMTAGEATWAEDARELAHRPRPALRQAIERVDCGQFAPGLKITASIGLAERTGLPHRERLVSRADQKLYEAKNGGRNRVVS